MLLQTLAKENYNISKTIEFTEVTYFVNLLLVQFLLLLSQDTGPLREHKVDKNHNISYTRERKS